MVTTSRERDRNRKHFHKGHYEIIAARFREEFSTYVNEDGTPVVSYNHGEGLIAATALVRLCGSLANRFEFDNDEFEREIFFKRCSPYDEFDLKDWM